MGRFKVARGGGMSIPREGENEGQVLRWKVVHWQEVYGGCTLDLWEV